MCHRSALERPGCLLVEPGGERSDRDDAAPASPDDPQLVLAALVDALDQLSGEVGDRLVPGGRVALTRNGGGLHDGDNVAHVVHMFVR